MTSEEISRMLEEGLKQSAHATSELDGGRILYAIVIAVIAGIKEGKKDASDCS
jgi:hypothetical protein